MNIDKLLCFLDLVETRNYTETAERLFTTQSNVSKQILSLKRSWTRRCLTAPAASCT